MHNIAKLDLELNVVYVAKNEIENFNLLYQVVIYF